MAPSCPALPLTSDKTGSLQSSGLSARDRWRRRNHTHTRSRKLRLPLLIAELKLIDRIIMTMDNCGPHSRLKMLFRNISDKFHYVADT